MSKLLAIIRREYLQRVRSKSFIISTVLGPLLAFGLMAVPVLLIMLKTGETPRLAIVDQTGKMAERVRESIVRPPDSETETAPGESAVERAFKGGDDERGKRTDDASHELFKVEVVPLVGRSLEDVRRELNERIVNGDLDAYLILPPDVLTRGNVQYYGRNVGDVITVGQLAERLNRAILEQRMVETRIDPALARGMAQPVNMSKTKISLEGEEKDSGGSFFLVVGIGLLIMFTVSSYGGAIFSAVTEEKQTRIIEILFASVRPFHLLMGKLVGVSLVAMTQYAIWALALIAFTLLGVGSFIERGLEAPLPRLSVLTLLYFFLFFLLGYFVYATIYVLDGSMGTDQQSGWVAKLAVLLQVAGYFLMFPVLRSPDSSLAFWASMFPFFSPILMPVRLVSQMPPFWQIALSLLVGFSTVILLIRIAARIYRTGMLMYGKRATIPEVVRWIRQK